VEGSGFLPPEPPGPEPELGGKPAAPPSLAAQPQPPYAPPAPPGGQPPPYQAPPPGQGYAPPPGYVPPSGYPPPYGYPQPPVPDNGPAVAGFVLGLVSGGLLLISAGLSSLISVGCAIAGMIYSRKGKQKVAAGETPKNAGLARAGWIIGIVALVLSLLATAGWILVLVLAVTDDQFRDDLERELDDSQSIRAALSIGAAALRVLG
jgi:hypothetical protein